MLLFLAGDDNADLENTDFVSCAREYFRKGGMDDAQIDSFLEKLS